MDSHSGEGERTACLLSLLTPLTWTVSLPDQMNNTRTRLSKRRNLKLVGYVFKLTTSTFDHALNVHCLKLASGLAGRSMNRTNLQALHRELSFFPLKLNNFKRSKKSYSGECSLRNQPSFSSRKLCIYRGKTTSCLNSTTNSRKLAVKILRIAVIGVFVTSSTCSFRENTYRNESATSVVLFSV